MGITTLKEVWGNKGMVPFMLLKTKYNMHKFQRFRYLQLKHVLTASVGDDRHAVEDSQLENGLLLLCTEKQYL